MITRNILGGFYIQVPPYYLIFLLLVDHYYFTSKLEHHEHGGEIQIGKELIKQGIVWIIGPSTLIKALKAKWLLEANGYIPKLKLGFSGYENIKVAYSMQIWQRS